MYRDLSYYPQINGAFFLLGAPFIGNFASICGVCSGAAFNRISTVIHPGARSMAQLPSDVFSHLRRLSVFRSTSAQDIAHFDTLTSTSTFYEVDKIFFRFQCLVLSNKMGRDVHKIYRNKLYKDLILKGEERLRSHTVKFRK